MLGKTQVPKTNYLVSRKEWKDVYTHPEIKSSSLIIPDAQAVADNPNIKDKKALLNYGPVSQAASDTYLVHIYLIACSDNQAAKAALCRIILGYPENTFKAHETELVRAIKDRIIRRLGGDRELFKRFERDLESILPESDETFSIKFSRFCQQFTKMANHETIFQDVEIFSEKKNQTFDTPIEIFSPEIKSMEDFSAAIYENSMGKITLDQNKLPKGINETSDANLIGSYLMSNPDTPEEKASIKEKISQRLGGDLELLERFEKNLTQLGKISDYSGENFEKFCQDFTKMADNGGKITSDHLANYATYQPLSVAANLLFNISLLYNKTKEWLGSTFPALFGKFPRYSCINNQKINETIDQKNTGVEDIPANKNKPSSKQGGIFLGRIPESSDDLSRLGEGDLVVGVIRAGEQNAVSDAHYYKNLNQNGIRHQSVEMQDFGSTVSLPMAVKAISEMHNTIMKDNNVYIHCKAGRARSGTLVATWLAMVARDVQAGNGKEYMKKPAYEEFVKAFQAKQNESPQTKMSDAQLFDFAVDFIKEHRPQLDVGANKRITGLKIMEVTQAFTLDDLAGKDFNYYADENSKKAHEITQSTSYKALAMYALQHPEEIKLRENLEKLVNNPDTIADSDLFSISTENDELNGLLENFTKDFQDNPLTKLEDAIFDEDLDKPLQSETGELIINEEEKSSEDIEDIPEPPSDPPHSPRMQ